MLQAKPSLLDFETNIHDFLIQRWWGGLWNLSWNIQLSPQYPCQELSRYMRCCGPGGAARWWVVDSEGVADVIAITRVRCGNGCCLSASVRRPKNAEQGSRSWKIHTHIFIASNLTKYTNDFLMLKLTSDWPIFVTWHFLANQRSNNC